MIKPILFFTLLVSSAWCIVFPADWPTTLDDLAEEIFTCKDIPGFSVAIVHNGQTILTKGYGTANFQKGSNVTDNTLYGIASLSKAMAMALLAKVLKDDGRYTLDTTVKTILGSDFHFSDDLLDNYATIRDLASHRTGLAAYTQTRMQDGFSRKLLAQKAEFYKRVNDFRSLYLYSDVTYGLISYLTEYVGQDTWENLIQRHIFDPLQMTRSTFTHMIADNEEDVALPVLKSDNEWRPISQDLHRYWGLIGGSGSIMSTAKDMTHWMNAILNNGQDPEGNVVIPVELHAEITKSHIPIPDCSDCPKYRRPYNDFSFTFNEYGLGWRRGFYRGYQILTHTGSSFAYLAKITLFPDLNLGFHVSLTGNDPGYQARRAITSFLIDNLLGESSSVTLDNVCYYPLKTPPSNPPTQPTVLADSLSQAESQIYLGLFTNDAFGTINVLFNKTTNRMQLSYGHLGLWDLYPLPGEEYSFEGVGLDHVWFMPIKKVLFGGFKNEPSQEIKKKNLMENVEIPSWESQDPPIFLRMKDKEDN